ncbi:MAG TPA: sodium/proline symporter [Longimicrobiales bacterium]|nr:sodium/proline symporter [Longimicrobiales bacterium]
MQDAVTGVGASGPLALAAFVGYLLMVLAIGVYATRFSSQGVGEFFVGGRRMNRFVVALSAVVSGRSAWLLLGVTGVAYTRGASAIWTVTGYTAVEFILFLTLAPRLRAFAEEHDCVTLPDVFAARFNDRDGWLRLTLAVVLLLFMVGYVSAQFTAGGKAIGASFGVTPGIGVLITAGIVLGYTMTGGFLAVSLTDTLQAVFMLVGLVLLPVVAFRDGGGFAAVMGELRGFDPALVDPLALGVGAFLGMVGIGLGSPGNPQIVVRFMSIADQAQLRFAAWVATFWNVVMGVGAVAIGLAGRVLIPDVSVLPGADPESLYPVLAQEHLPPVLFGVVVASIFAAIMSTADSQLLVGASTVARDVYEKVLNRDRAVDPRRLVWISRLVVAALVVAALLLGVVAEDVVFWLVLFAWGGLGAAIGPPLLFSLYWRGTTRSGVVAGMAVGTLVTVVWELVPVLKGALYGLIPAFFLSALAVVVVSAAGRR